MLKSLAHILSTLIHEWDTLALPQPQFLDTWFRELWELFEESKKRGALTKAGWFTTSDGLRLLEQTKDNKGNLPLYNVELLNLPQVKKLDTRYAPVLSSTTLSSSPAHQPDIQERELLSWRLDLWLNPSGECPVRDGVQFVCIRDNHPLSKSRYELDFLNGRKLSAFEAFFVKSIFDISIHKLPRK